MGLWCAQEGVWNWGFGFFYGFERSWHLHSQICRFMVQLQAKCQSLSLILSVEKPRPVQRVKKAEVNFKNEQLNGCCNVCS